MRLSESDARTHRTPKALRCETWKRFSPFCDSFGSARIACDGGALCSCRFRLAPLCGERIEVRGRLIPFSEMASGTKIILTESRALITKESNRTRAHSLASSAEPKFCRLQISTSASTRLLCN